jgi:hypothetical protein
LNQSLKIILNWWVENIWLIENSIFIVFAEEKRTCMLSYSQGKCYDS